MAVNEDGLALYGRPSAPAVGQPSEIDLDQTILDLTADRVRAAMSSMGENGAGELDETMVSRIANAVLGIGLDELPIENCTMLVQYRVTVWQWKEGEAASPAIFDRCYSIGASEEKIRRQAWKDVRYKLDHLNM